MIETVTAYKVGNETFPTLEEAQVAKITQIVLAEIPDLQPQTLATTAKFIYNNFDKFAAVMGATPVKAKTRKPRKDKGQKRQKQAPAEESGGVTVEGSGKYAGK